MRAEGSLDAYLIRIVVSHPFRKMRGKDGAPDVLFPALLYCPKIWTSSAEREDDVDRGLHIDWLAIEQVGTVAPIAHRVKC